MLNVLTNTHIHTNTRNFLEVTQVFSTLVVLIVPQVYAYI